MKYFKNVGSLFGVVVIGVMLVCPMAWAAWGSTSGKVLIVSNRQKFGDPVVLRVAQVLRKGGVSVKVSIGTSLKGAEAGKYGAVIIINYISDAKKDRSVTVFADEAVQKKIVLFNAVGEYLKPDAAGSTPVKLDNIVSDIVARTKLILAQ